MNDCLERNCDTAIIILNYNSWRETLDEVHQCIEVLNFKYCDIVVVDNCSINESSKNLLRESERLGFCFIQSSKNNGYAAGNNIGLKYAFKKGYYSALILNNDIVIQNSNLIEMMNSYLKKDSSLAIISPDILSPSGYLFNRYSKRPSLYDFTIGMYRYKKTGRILKDLSGYGYVYRPQGCCMLVKLDAINDVGYLDEHTFLYYEEAIIAEKLLLTKRKCACCTRVSVVHNHSYTVNKVFQKSKIVNMKNHSFVYYLTRYRKFGFIKVILCYVFNTIKLYLL